MPALDSAPGPESNPWLKTGWVKPPNQITGLDHLGVQAPGIEIYGQLLPGITNVTDRARYYSFYAWLFYQFEQRSIRRYEQWRPVLRRAECLFALIALRHGNISKGPDRDHSAAVVGTINLWKAIQHLAEDDRFRLSALAAESDEASEIRYFMNPNGGLGQYYFGALTLLGILTGESVAQARLTKPTGVSLAQAMDAGVDAEAFFRAIEDDQLTLSRLDSLAAFCPCHLAGNRTEREQLLALFLHGQVLDEGKPVANGETEESWQARARSLAYFQWLTAQCDGLDGTFVRDCFRPLVYARTAHQGEPLEIPPTLESVADCWQVYQRHELLSVALQAQFFALLRVVELSNPGKRFTSTKALSQWFWHEGPGSQLLGTDTTKPFGDWLAERASSLPPFGDWQNEGHEIQALLAALRLSRTKGLGKEGAQELADCFLTILAALLLRLENSDDYGELRFRPHYLDDYPVNLLHLRRDYQQRLAGLPIRESLEQLSLGYVLDAHVRVALRKLRVQGQNTFRFECSEIGIVIRDVPRVAETSPRLVQSLRILTDLGLLAEQGDRLVPTGESLLESLI